MSYYDDRAVWRRMKQHPDMLDVLNCNRTVVWWTESYPTV